MPGVYSIWLGKPVLLQVGTKEVRVQLRGTIEQRSVEETPDSRRLDCRCQITCFSRTPEVKWSGKSCARLERVFGRRSAPNQIVPQSTVWND